MKVKVNVTMGLWRDILQMYINMVVWDDDDDDAV